MPACQSYNLYLSERVLQRPCQQNKMAFSFWKESSNSMFIVFAKGKINLGTFWQMRRRSLAGRLCQQKWVPMANEYLFGYFNNPSDVRQMFGRASMVCWGGRLLFPLMFL